MRKSDFSDQEILGILNQAETTISPKELCKKYGVSVQTFYRWRRQYGARVKSNVQRLKALEDENSRLRKLLVEKELENHRLRAAIEKGRSH
jgi:putative transposase